MSKKKQERLEANFQQIDEILGLSEMTSMKEKVQKIIIFADETMTAICKHADMIKIDNYNAIKEKYEGLGIGKGLWVELVQLKKFQRYSAIPAKLFKKIEDSTTSGKHDIALRESAINNIIKDSKLVATDVFSPKTIDYKSEFELESDFQQLLEDSADIREELDSKLWPYLKVIGDAFIYVTNDSWKTFKFLLDMYHYRNGGWPNPDTPPRSWSIVERYEYAYRTMDKYGFDDIKKWSKRFGLEVTLSQKSPTFHKFTDYAELFSKYLLLRIREENLEKYKDLGITVQHNLLVHDGLIYAFTWDTRIIDYVYTGYQIDISDCHANFGDPCEPLTVNKENIDPIYNSAIHKISELIISSENSDSPF